MKKLENLKTKNFYEYISLLFIFVSGTIYFTYEKQIILCLVYYVIFLILFLFLCN